EDELGFTYAEVDQLLYLWVDRHYSPQDLVAAGFSETFVQQVIKQVRRNQFKRRLPPIAKLGEQTAGYDFFVPADLQA
ncbi:MAG TPA: NAD(+) synthetase, partial [Anaerolineales bacterium]|nr:NAD(+) synthetase [Anaerolineales bacterium]